MLSKSQAKIFYLAATVGFSGVFLALSVDTILQVPVRTNEAQMTEQVVRGRVIWDENNCMGCHTLLGEGAYYAPELTKVVERRGKPWMRTFLKDPEAMYPGKRKMINYHFTDEEIEDVIAFFEWIGGIDTNGFPPVPDLAQKPVLAASTIALAKNAPKKYTEVCAACHSVGGQGGNVGPALDGVATRFTQDQLDKWLADPQSVKPGTSMPNLGLDAATRGELVNWLMTLK